MHEKGQIKSPWLTLIKTTLDSCGLRFLWLNPGLYPTKAVKLLLNKTLKDQFTQNWQQDIASKSSWINYRIFKSLFKPEIYQTKLSSHHATQLCKFRMRNANFPVHRAAIDPNHSPSCHLCAGNKVGDEYHYLLECSFFKPKRKTPLRPYFNHHPNCIKMLNLFNSTNVTELTNLARFCAHIMSRLKD